jgi:hypothetical protein
MVGFTIDRLFVISFTSFWSCTAKLPSQSSGAWRLSMAAMRNNIYEINALNVSSNALLFFQGFRLFPPDGDGDGIPDVDECN